MRAALALGAVLALAACGEASQGSAEAPAGEQNSAKAASTEAQTSAPGQRTTMGTTSGLSGQTSALSGQITDFRVTVTEASTNVALASDTLFAFDKAELANGAIDNLTRVADLVRKGGPGAVTIVGHTDDKGEDAYNQSLSERRAEAVAAWLRQQPKLARREFVVIGKGETSPEAQNARPDGSDNPDGRARNRRVEVQIPRA